MKEADVCLLLEGTYPYVAGGVSTWTHDLILAHDDLTFHIVAFLPPGFNKKPIYKLPKNVLGLHPLYIQEMPRGDSYLSNRKKEALFTHLEEYLLRLQYKGKLSDLEEIMSLFADTGVELGEQILMLSQESWRLLVRMYSASMGTSGFLDYFWSWRGLFGGLFSLLLFPIIPAKVYHALCTGYAGMYAARAHLETGRPSMITEHGIYTNERRIEIASAHWIEEALSTNLNIERHKTERGLKDLWIDTFSSYSRICYEACQKVITLHEGNQPLQIADGADKEKMMLISNGINVKKYSAIKRKSGGPKTIALIGRVVPIKDIKTFIRAVAHLSKDMSEIVAYIIGPTDEDPHYFEECKQLVEHYKIESIITFTGRVDLKDWLPKIDLTVLTSISESQPLILLEAGASGIPSVATHVGSCHEILYGRKDESPQLGEGGLIAPLANPLQIAKQIERLLVDEELYMNCSNVIKERVRIYYNEDIQRKAYDKLYKSMMKEPALEKEVK